MELRMGIIKVEVSLPEAAQAIEEFGRNRIQAFEVITSELKTAVGHTFNHLLQTEMSIFLGKPEQSGNKRNGYEERENALKGVGCIRIRMPQDRKSQFNSQVIVPWSCIIKSDSEEQGANCGKLNIAMAPMRVVSRWECLSEGKAMTSAEDVLKQYETKINLHSFEAVEALISDEVVFWFSDGSFCGKPEINAAFEKTWNLIRNETYWLENLVWIARGDEAASCTYTRGNASDV